MLGLVANGKRSIRSGSQYDKFFTSATQGNEVELVGDGDVYDTLQLMKKIVDETLSQTKAISRYLKGSTIEETCRNVWNFLYQHVQYKKDNPIREQLRTPARTWKDRTSGVDCDCYSIFISSVLTNLGVAHCFRMAAYKDDYQHVYVVVPKNGNTLSSKATYFIIDPVVNSFNHEEPYSKKHDNKMAKVTMLNGLGTCVPTKPDIKRIRKFVDTQQLIDQGLVPTKYFLDANRLNYAPAFDNENDESVYIVTTPTGMKKVPTVITKTQAAALLNHAAPTVVCTPAKVDNDSDTSNDLLEAFKKKFNWWWLLVGAGAWLLLTGSDQNEVKSGLDGLKVKVSKPTQKKKKYKTISI